MTAALLPLTVVLATLSAALFVVSLRRRDPLSGLAGMTIMIVASIPAAAYASLAD